jgi:hypothetical protein
MSFLWPWHRCVCRPIIDMCKPPVSFAWFCQIYAHIGPQTTLLLIYFFQDTCSVYLYEIGTLITCIQTEWKWNKNQIKMFSSRLFRQICAGYLCQAFKFPCGGGNVSVPGFPMHCPFRTVLYILLPMITNSLLSLPPHPCQLQSTPSPLGEELVFSSFWS